ncbi:PTBP3 protein, partial [Chionis minor]|nr:PTBP3 protein [Chionis minor]
NEEKFKGDRSPCSPSRVLHLRDIPSDVTEAEVISLGLPFGKVTNLLMLKGRSQALLEMASEEDAISMVNYYTPARPYLRCQPVCIQYSNHRELKTDNLPNQARAQAALQAVNAMPPGNVATGDAFADQGGLAPGQGSVLHIIIENIFYLITLEVLYEVFSKFGCVLRIVTFTKNNQFQALLEYADPVSAHDAQMALDGQSIGCYTGCCTLRVDFSKLSSLKVKYNNGKSRDFTRFDLPFGYGPPPLEPSMPAAYGCFCFLKCLFPFEMSSDAINTFPGLSVPAVSGALGCLAVTVPAVPEHMIGVPAPRVTGSPGNSVLLVRNLNPEALIKFPFWIFTGVYGVVHRVKIMFKKKENALVQMEDAAQAQLAISNLNGQRLYGRVLHATLSKHWTVKLPSLGQENHGLTKDYSNSPLHRFKNPGSRDLENIFPPSATLHLSNIPPSVTVDYLKNIFASAGSTVKDCKFLQNDGKMALIQLGCVEEALQALIELHNYDLGDNHHLQISFSKCTI